MESNHKFSLTFSVTNHIEFGQEIYVLGSIPELGNWKNFVAKLKWNPGHIWKGTFNISAEYFEYKYMIYTAKTQQKEWEFGRNRIFDAKRCDKSKPIILDEDWEMFRIVFRIYYPLNEDSFMRINGNLINLGSWNEAGPKNCQLTKEEYNLPNGGKGRVWEHSILAPLCTEVVSYKYSVYNMKTKIAVWEREPTRVIKIPSKMEYKDFLEIEKEKNPSNFTQIMIPINSEIIQFDVNFVSDINFDRIEGYPIIIGAYPQHEDDIKILEKSGVTGLINLTTDIDMKHRSVDWEKMVELYKKHGIKAVNCPIHDFNPPDLIMKLPKVAEIMNSLIEEKKIVYIHCTAGMGRAPSGAIAYLVLYEKMGIQDAYDLIKKYRKVADPNIISLRKALDKNYINENKVKK